MKESRNVLAIDRQDRIVRLKLCRPEKRNALNDAAIRELGDFFAGPPPGIAAIVLEGAGPHFCAGLDLAELLEKKRTDVMEGVRHSRGWHRVFNSIQYGEVPVVCCLKGAVIGGGLELAAATHVRICEPSTFYQLPEGQHGIFLGGGGSVRIPRIIGAGRVVEMMLTGRKCDAQEGLRLGLAHRLVPEGTSFETAMEIATAIASNSFASNYAIINGISRIGEMGPDEGLFAETMVAMMTSAAQADRARIKAFFERRAAASKPADAEAAEIGGESHD